MMTAPALPTTAAARELVDPEAGEASHLVPSVPDRPRPDRRSLRRETSTGDSA